MTNLVTGADGFVGQHLISELLDRGEAVVGAVRSLPPQLDTLPSDSSREVRWVSFDLEVPESVRSLVREHPVDRVFHLAAFASAAKSIDDPAAAFRVNVIGTLHLLEELTILAREARARPRILISGSGDIYGSAANHCRPLVEDCPIEPLNPYAVSKAAQEALGLQYHRAYGLPVIVTRSFNHTGPGQKPPYAAADFAIQILAIQQQGGSGVVRIGDPAVRRDFTDVRDVVRAYADLMELGEPGCPYNVCSGASYSIAWLVETLAELADVDCRVEVVPARRRPAEVEDLVGSYARLEDATRWQPEIGLQRSLGDLMKFLRETHP